MFEYITITKIRNNTIEAPLGIPGTSTKGKNNFRVKLLIESDIGFLLEFDRKLIEDFSSEIVCFVVSSLRFLLTVQAKRWVEVITIQQSKCSMLQLVLFHFDESR